MNIGLKKMVGGAVDTSADESDWNRFVESPGSEAPRTNKWKTGGCLLTARSRGLSDVAVQHEHGSLAPVSVFDQKRMRHRAQLLNAAFRFPGFGLEACPIATRAADLEGIARRVEKLHRETPLFA